MNDVCWRRALDIAHVSMGLLAVAIVILVYSSTAFSQPGWDYVGSKVGEVLCILLFATAPLLVVQLDTEYAITPTTGADKISCTYVFYRSIQWQRFGQR